MEIIKTNQSLAPLIAARIDYCRHPFGIQLEKAGPYFSRQSSCYRPDLYEERGLAVGTVDPLVCRQIPTYITHALCETLSISHAGYSDMFYSLWRKQMMPAIAEGEYLDIIGHMSFVGREPEGGQDITAVFLDTKTPEIFHTIDEICKYTGGSPYGILEVPQKDLLTAMKQTRQARKPLIALWSSDPAERVKNISRPANNVLPDFLFGLKKMCDIDSFRGYVFSPFYFGPGGI